MSDAILVALISRASNVLAVVTSPPKNRTMTSMKFPLNDRPP